VLKAACNGPVVAMEGVAVTVVALLVIVKEGVAC
jgi:hypothetical protein